eukprot:Gb_36756 [translate_table: standard]
MNEEAYVNLGRRCGGQLEIRRGRRSLCKKHLHLKELNREVQRYRGTIKKKSSSKNHFWTPGGGSEEHKTKHEVYKQEESKWMSLGPGFLCGGPMVQHLICLPLGSYKGMLLHAKVIIHAFNQLLMSKKQLSKDLRWRKLDKGKIWSFQSLFSTIWNSEVEGGLGWSFFSFFSSQLFSLPLEGKKPMDSSF